jgi:hypothetical protein
VKGSFCAIVLVILASSVANAHIKLDAPKARSNDQVQLKYGPCGQSTSKRTANVATFKPGETITVKWTETINHPGHFRISFDPNGENFPDPKSFTDFASGPTDLVDNIPDNTVAMGNAYSVDVTLPNIECTSCTLQVIQVMTDKPPYGDGNDVYYQCADLILASDDAGSDSDAAATDSGSSIDAGTTPSSGGCSIGAPRAPRTGVWLTGAILFLLGRRRRGDFSGYSRRRRVR